MEQNALFSVDSHTTLSSSIVGVTGSLWLLLIIPGSLAIGAIVLASNDQAQRQRQAGVTFANAKGMTTCLCLSAAPR